MFAREVADGDRAKRREHYMRAGLELDETVAPLSALSPSPARAGG